MLDVAHIYCEACWWCWQFSLLACIFLTLLSICMQARQELEAKSAEAASLNRQLHGSMEEVKQLEAARAKKQAKVGVGFERLLIEGIIHSQAVSVICVAGAKVGVRGCHKHALHL